ncbi:MULTISPECIES: hypothetical protein [Mesorhizobium]|uniref:hypothetical protein n=1 Tax=Mesorhizobium TaxID=68287 RepID=UPI00035DDC33|nr:MULTISPECIES: hypothetical protein [Mesorhizobium]ANN60811.1 hypothetical protein A9174_31685 [Mesorhizobium loti NZP2037]OBP79942.1 hypothetical protein BAE41_29275 [Mesorhizobium loti]OBP96410.1 hypothetical protein BAE38_29540 [Mesorhizobium loti]OBQ73238.1 hypothetical protein A9K72_31625 [Mesorhizobium loti]
MSIAAKNVSPGQHLDVSRNALPTKIENLRQFADSEVGMCAKAQDPKAIRMRCCHQAIDKYLHWSARRQIEEPNPCPADFVISRSSQMLFGGGTQNDTRFLQPLNSKVVVSVPLIAICGRKVSVNFLEGSVATPKRERNEIGEVLGEAKLANCLGKREAIGATSPGDSAKLLRASDPPFA